MKRAEASIIIILAIVTAITSVFVAIDTHRQANYTQQTIEDKSDGT